MSGGNLVIFGLARSPTAEEPRPASRLGITLPRHVGNAVERNRIRRRVREIARRHWGELSAAGPAGNPADNKAAWDLVVNPRRTALTTDFAALEAEWLGALRRLTGAGTQGTPRAPRPETPGRRAAKSEREARNPGEAKGPR